MFEFDFIKTLFTLCIGSANFIRRAATRQMTCAATHGLLYIWTELLYLTCPHKADLLTLIILHKLTQYL